MNGSNKIKYKKTYIEKKHVITIYHTDNAPAKSCLLANIINVAPASFWNTTREKQSNKTSYIYMFGCV